MKLLILIIIMFSNSALAQEITEAQPLLPQKNIDIISKNGTHKILAEIAETEVQRKTGLMFREYLAPDRGMLFLIPKEDEAKGIWMKNTKIPLDVLFIGDDNIVKCVHKNAIPALPSDKDEDIDVVSCDKATNLVLELAAGVVEKLQLKVGDKIEVK